MPIVKRWSPCRTTERRGYGRCRPASRSEHFARRLGPAARDGFLPWRRLTVTGGWTGFEQGKGSSFYVFETATGRLLRRVGGLPEFVNRLAWSPDGRYVAAGLLGANGIRLFETTGWHEVARDADYAGAVYGLNFDGSGRLAAAAFDGIVRLYNPDLQPIAKSRAPGGARPETVAFSPNGSTLAVGYNDTLNIDVLSVPDLRRVAAANVSGLTGGNLGQVAWGGDGTLFAAGTNWSAETGSSIFHWADSSRAHNPPRRRSQGFAIDELRVCMLL